MSCQAFASEFGETEVENFHDAIAAKHDVVGLDVAMDDADAVSGAKGTGDLNSDVDRFARLERRCPYSLAQCFAVDEFGCDELFVNRSRRFRRS